MDKTVERSRKFAHFSNVFQMIFAVGCFRCNAGVLLFQGTFSHHVAGWNLACTTTILCSS